MIRLTDFNQSNSQSAKLHSASPFLQVYTHLYICKCVAVCGCTQCQETDFLYFAVRRRKKRHIMRGLILS